VFLCCAHDTQRFIHKNIYLIFLHGILALLNPCSPGLVVFFFFRKSCFFLISHIVVPSLQDEMYMEQHLGFVFRRVFLLGMLSPQHLGFSTNVIVFFIVMQISNEEVKHVEISKLQKMVEALNLELDEAKLATINESNRNAVLQNQLQLSVKEKSSLERELVAMDEVRKENAQLKVLHVK